MTNLKRKTDSSYDLLDALSQDLYILSESLGSIQAVTPPKRHVELHLKYISDDKITTVIRRENIPECSREESLSSELPVIRHRKRTRVIDDIEHSRRCQQLKEDNSTDLSLDKIKRLCGVDPNKLEESFSAFQQETCPLPPIDSASDTIEKVQPIVNNNVSMANVKPPDTYANDSVSTTCITIRVLVPDKAKKYLDVNVNLAAG